MRRFKNVQDSTICEAVQIALKEVEGAYAIVVIDENEPEVLIAARKSSPLVIGVGEEGEYFVGSDATPIIEYTNNVIYLDDEEVAVMHRSHGVDHSQSAQRVSLQKSTNWSCKSKS